MRTIQNFQVRRQSLETLQQKKKARAEFLEKKSMIQAKIKELRSQGKGVEEIYKYTSDIIFEDDAEQLDTTRVNNS